jgi:two-component system cell cycle response regulator DivK
MKKVLVVQDDNLNGSLNVQLLEVEYQVLTANDGIEALQMARKHAPDIILMDMWLPVMDGWEATRRFKIDEKLCVIPVIALIAHDMRDGEERVRGFGCDDYLAKPIEADLLLEKLKCFLEDRNTMA